MTSLARAQHVDPRDGAQPGAPPIEQRVHFALDFQGAPGCAERALFEDALRIQLLLNGSSWDPFAPVSPSPLKVRVTRSRGWFEGKAEVYGPDGRYRGTHTMPGPLRCYDVIAGLASALAADATPLHVPRPKHSDPVCPESKAEAAPVCPESPSSVWPAEPPSPPLRAPEPDPPKPREAPLSFRFGAGLWADLVANDRGSLGLTLDAGVRYRFFSVGIEARGNPPLGATLTPNAGSLNYARVTGALLVCGHFEWVIGCAKGEAGRLLFPGAVPSEPALGYGAAGVRLGMEYPVVPQRFLLRMMADVGGTINPATIARQNVSIFQVAGWSAGFGVGALFAVGSP